MSAPTRYRDAGVDISAGEEAIRRIRDTVRSTFGPQVVTDIGNFAGVTTIPGTDSDVLLVSSMDGVTIRICGVGVSVASAPSDNNACLRGPLYSSFSSVGAIRAMNR